VRPGDRVHRGELIGTAGDGKSAAVHAPAAGSVVGLEDRLVPAGTGLVSSTCVVIAVDRGSYDRAAVAEPAWPPDRAARLRAIRDAGIVGLGGAAFPTAAKLDPPRSCETLILNGAECEPYISCDDMLMREHAADVVAGARVMLELLGGQRCIIAVERDKAVAFGAMRAALEALDDERLTLVAIPTIYPAGGERQLVESLLGIEVPAGAYPSAVGVVCQNVATARALADYAANATPLTSRIVTVTGHGVRMPQNVDAPIGASISDLVEHCGGYGEGVAQLILGGNMMGYALPSDDIPVTKSTNCIIAMAAAESWASGAEWPCIRCGDCASACPARLQPQALLRAARPAQPDALIELGLDDCIECGCCDVACPSHIALTAAFRSAKTALQTYRDQQQRAVIAERHYAEHMARIATTAADADREQRDLRAALTTDAAGRRSAIEAAIDRARRRLREPDGGES
ncbi:MAG TPA: electron transport complex subunit RsxC, partial [Gammaproteobacteria bacterium]|nr:electron transport complex subunit RsxC [Gammaproteobacteria bacterium]